MAGWPLRNSEVKVLKPKKLRRGDQIGLVAPASAFPEERLDRAVAWVQQLGYQPVLGKHVKASLGYLAGTDEQRVEDLHRMFADSSIAGIWAIRGGYGCTRLLPRLDFELIRKNPKVLLGYSDITALHIALAQETGLVTFHAPVASAKPTPYTATQLRRVLEAKRSLAIQPYEDSTDPAYVIHPGTASGLLTGGNLSLLAAMAGTPWSPSFAGKLVFLEDIDEKPYRIDRMLVQLFQATDLAEAAGVLMGVFRGCEPDPDDRSLTLEETLRHQFGQLKVPVYYGFSFGHIANQCTIPIGVGASFDTSEAILRLHEAPMGA